jgi:hypothetical protein
MIYGDEPIAAENAAPFSYTDDNNSNSKKAVPQSSVYLQYRNRVAQEHITYLWDERGIS